ncbi:tetratricopeptide repeat protein [Flammeovirga sp. MY04]|uniref:tetratricopeptide repeat protein n=1 Tax=Flammeovirga sp. MY04 TaxID=1191459 RepID=UPI0008060F69|nr:tetratricopeptide repeat protein [Flammeovirga sp. MY04]ANQ51230.1 tetratricopeptide repeat protein [Flammeovirga sp. MY04]
MKHKQNITLFALIISGLSFFSCSPSSQELTNQGKQKLSDSKFKEAISLFDAALKEDNQNADAYNARGVAFMSLEEYSQAKKSFTLAINVYENSEKDFPKAYQYFYNRGNANRFQRDHEEAILDYTKAIQLDDTIADIYLNRALENAEINGVDQALTDFDKAIELSKGKDKRAFLHKAKVLIAVKQFDAALKTIENAINLDKKYGEAYYFKALALSGKIGKANDEVCDLLASAEVFGYPYAATEIQKHCE